MSNRSLTDIRAVITGALGLIGLYLVVCSVLFNSAEEMSKTGGINANPRRWPAGPGPTTGWR